MNRVWKAALILGCQRPGADGETFRLARERIAQLENGIRALLLDDRAALYHHREELEELLAGDQLERTA